MRHSFVKFNVLVLCALIVCSSAAPCFEPIFADTKIVKRDVVSENADKTLKQVSLQSLIGGLEHSLVQSALSVSSLMHDSDAVLPEVTPPTDAVENLTNKKLDSEHNGPTEAATSSASAAQRKEIILQAMKKVPATDGQPAHLIIERVTVQNHIGGIPIVPPFEVHHTKVKTTGINSGSSTEINAAKTSTTPTTTSAGSATENPAKTTAATTTTAVATTSVENTATVAGTTATTAAGSTTANSAVPTLDSQSTTVVKPTNSVESSTTPATTKTTASGLDKSTESVTSNSSSTTVPTESTTATPTSSTTKTPIVKLKEAEEDLKEKVAEIEADPIILSSRI